MKKIIHNMDILNENDELGRQICEYFVSLNQKMKDLEQDMDNKFKDFDILIKKLPADEQKKYQKFKDMMDIVSLHYGEGDWPCKIYEGDEFGSHYLGYHLDDNRDCCYCCEKRDHDAGKHDIIADAYCAQCNDKRGN